MLLFIGSCTAQEMWRTVISIHLMLLFIASGACGGVALYSISIHLMLLFIQIPDLVQAMCPDFNTSHVTVYRNASVFSTYLCDISIHLMLLFIQARHRNGWRARFISIHLMLLFIHMQHWFHLSLPHFNTSHVTVYRYPGFTVTNIIQISIHLMLLFIEYNAQKLGTEYLFQYISCYCLSKGLNIVSVTAMLFQYISCYCLSFWLHVI